MSQLFSPIRLGGVDLANRLVVAPMCQYSAADGAPQPWHAQHLGALALSGAGLVIVEATGVTAEGRITPGDTGLWNDAQEAAFTELLAQIRTYATAKLGVQLAHAGRKASTTAPWIDRGRPLRPEEGAWETVSASALAFDEGWPAPHALDRAGMDAVLHAFADSARRAHRAGFDLVELHAAHGYLLTQFASALSNRRTDAYGGSLENRLRFPLEVAAALREAWPRERALGARLNGSDWTPGGITPEEAVAFSRELKALGYDYVHLTSGGNVAKASIPGTEPGYQTPFAAAVKAAVPGLPVMAVGMISTPQEAEAVISRGEADMVALARAVLDDPRWGWRAARALGAPGLEPPQYARAAQGAWAGYPRAHSQAAGVHAG